MIQNKIQTRSVLQGSSQRERLPAALEDNYVLVDEMSFESLIVLGKRIASQLTFPSDNANESTTWDRLFDDNEVVIMAMISTINCKHEQ